MPPVEPGNQVPRGGRKREPGGASRRRRRGSSGNISGKLLGVGTGVGPAPRMPSRRTWPLDGRLGGLGKQRAPAAP